MTTPPEVTSAFNEAAGTALRELVALETWPAPAASEMATASSSPIICAQIDLLREAPGKMTLVLNASTAAVLAQRYLPTDAALSDEIVNDVAGEIANVIAGQAKTLLKGTPHHFSLSTPKVERHEHAPEWTPSANAICAIALTTEVGAVTMYVS